MERENRVLVAYASRRGTTRGVAERVAARLGEGGSRVEARPADEVRGVDAYDTVVFGSAVYNQRWLPEGREFLRANREGLAKRPVWLFSVGAFGDTHRVLGGLVGKAPRDIGTFQEAIRPRGYRFFAGAIERDQWPWFGRLLFRAFGGRFGDNRDWREIDAWIEGIAASLQRTAPG